MQANYRAHFPSKKALFVRRAITLPRFAYLFTGSACKHVVSAAASN